MTLFGPGVFFGERFNYKFNTFDRCKTAQFIHFFLAHFVKLSFLRVLRKLFFFFFAFRTGAILMDTVTTAQLKTIFQGVQAGGICRSPDTEGQEWMG